MDKIKKMRNVCKAVEQTLMFQVYIGTNVLENFWPCSATTEHMCILCRYLLECLWQYYLQQSKPGGSSSAHH